MLETIPDRMTLGDWQTEHGSVFAHLIDTAGATYLGSDATTMDFLLSALYGQRTVRPFFEKLSAQEVGAHIHTIYGHVWEKDAELFEQMLALEGDAVSSVQDDSKSNVERTTSTNQTNKTSGFDGAEMVDDNGSDITGTDGTENITSHTHKNVSTTQSGLIDKARAARQQEFHKRICRDIADLLTLSIY